MPNCSYSVILPCTCGSRRYYTLDNGRGGSEPFCSECRRHLPCKLLRGRDDAAAIARFFLSVLLVLGVVTLVFLAWYVNGAVPIDLDGPVRSPYRIQEPNREQGPTIDWDTFGQAE